ncbi:hypothetical protein [Nocardioides mangrovi]|uniref:Sulfotransferase n=1 Tax=Nocardioides mangrovi TaxID=2874580 RepID=A0ABS7U8L9_9ACTN|nr:hypothetical protein [Nocardioides mangrovi]MBZ5737296.1 hypothetical protein [Nocardioides mangrovi]
MSDAHEVPEAPAPEQPPTRHRLFLHVGMPKSGSTYLQAILANNREALKQHGFIYPYVQQEGMFHAAVEMTGDPEQWGLTAEQVEGTFDHLLRRGRRMDLDVVISHENFGTARTKQIKKIAARLTDFEPHVVLTVRDPVRMMAARWQERVKNGFAESFDEFAASVLEGLPTDPAEAGFWRGHNLAWLLDHWERVAPPERIHVVVTPSRGGEPDLLWHRFADALGFPPDVVDLSRVSRRNESLGAPQVAFLREVLDALGDRLPQPWYAEVVKRWFAQSVLSTVDSRRAITPAPVADRVAPLAHAWVEKVRTGGYQVHGDLDELISPPVPSGTPHPDTVTADEVLAGMPDVVAQMLLRTRDLRARIEELEEQNDALAAEVAELRLPPETRAARWRRRLLG